MYKLNYSLKNYYTVASLKYNFSGIRLEIPQPDSHYTDVDCLRVCVLALPNNKWQNCHSSIVAFCSKKSCKTGSKLKFVYVCFFSFHFFFFKVHRTSIFRTYGKWDSILFIMHKPFFSLPYFQYFAYFFSYNPNIDFYENYTACVYCNRNRIRFLLT